MNHPVAMLCRVLDVSTSGYNAWRTRALSARTQADAALTEQIVTVHAESRQTYGAPRIHAELRARGRQCGHVRVARLMQAVGIVGCHRRRQVVTTVREPARTAVPDRLERQFVAESPNTKWAADITSVPTWSGFLYLAIVLDVFSRRIVGWAMADHLTTALVLSALDMALWTRRPDPGVLILVSFITPIMAVSQDTSIAFGSRCREAGVVPSLGSRGDCFDNAVSEAFFASLECALRERSTFRTPRRGSPCSTTSRPSPTPSGATPRLATCHRPNLSGDSARRTRRDAAVVAAEGVGLWAAYSLSHAPRC